MRTPGVQLGEEAGGEQGGLDPPHCPVPSPGRPGGPSPTWGSAAGWFEACAVVNRKGTKQGGPWGPGKQTSFPEGLAWLPHSGRPARQPVPGSSFPGEPAMTLKTVLTGGFGAGAEEKEPRCPAAWGPAPPSPGSRWLPSGEPPALLRGSDRAQHAAVRPVTSLPPWAAGPWREGADTGPGGAVPTGSQQSPGGSPALWVVSLDTETRPPPELLPLRGSGVCEVTGRAPARPRAWGSTCRPHGSRAHVRSCPRSRRLRPLGATSPPLTASFPWPGPCPHPRHVFDARRSPESDGSRRGFLAAVRGD